MFHKRKRSDCHLSFEDVAATQFDQSRMTKRRQISPTNNALQNPWLSDDVSSAASDTSSSPDGNDYFPMMPTMATMSCDSCGRGDHAMSGDSMDVDTNNAATINTCAGCGRNTCLDCAMSCLGGQRCCAHCTESDNLSAIMVLARQMGTGWTGFTRDNRIYWRLA